MDYYGIPGNEEADRVAKLRTKQAQPNNSVSFSVKTTWIKEVIMPMTMRDDYHLHDRLEQVTLIRLGKGHKQTERSHVQIVYKLVPSTTDSCGLEDETTEHMLQRCPAQQVLRQN